MSFSKEIHKRAKTDEKFMYQIVLDGRYVPDKDESKHEVFFGRSELVGPVTVEDAVKVWALIKELLEK